MVTRRALALSFLDRYAGLLVNIGTSMVLARLLSPSEIGVFSVTMVLVGVLAGLRDMGATTYLIQERELTDDRIRATWAIQLSIGITLAILTALIAQPVAHFYQEPQMALILWILAVNFAINPFGSITVAWWMREMQFQWVALMRFTGAITGAGVSIYLAWTGLGPVSLAWSSLATTVAGIVIALAFRPKQLPKLPGFREIKRVFTFGGRITASSIVSSLSGGAPEAFLGRFQDMEQTGFYSRANGLVSMFNRLVMDAVNSVTLPLFSRKNREGEEIAALYLRAITMITGLGWTFLGCLAIAAFPVIRILYGDQWDDAVTMTRILCLSLALSLLASMAQSIMISKGMANTALKITVFLAIFSVLASLAGSMHSLHMMGWLLTISALMSCVIWLHNIKSIISFSWRNLAGRLFSSFLLASFSCIPFAATSIIYGFDEGAGAWLKLAAASFASLIVFMLSAWLFRHPLFEEFEQVYQRYAKSNA